MNGETKALDYIDNLTRLNNCFMNTKSKTTSIIKWTIDRMYIRISNINSTSISIKSSTEHWCEYNAISLVVNNQQNIDSNTRIRTIDFHLLWIRLFFSLVLNSDNKKRHLYKTRYLSMSSNTWSSGLLCHCDGILQPLPNRFTSYAHNTIQLWQHVHDQLVDEDIYRILAWS